MKTRFIMMPFLFAMALPVAAQPAGVDSTTGQKTGFVTGTGTSPATADFVNEAAIGNMFEILSSQIALQKKDSADEDFAQKIIVDHQKAAQDLQTLVSNGSVQATIPTALPQPYQDKLSKLSSLNGDAFQRQYRADQLAGHKDAVTLFQQYSTDGANQTLKTWAAATLPTLQMHLQMAEALSK